MEFYRLICKKAAILTNRLPQSSFMNEDLKVFAMFHFKLNILFSIGIIIDFMRTLLYTTPLFTLWNTLQ